MSQRRFRSIFISDVHLGTPDCNAVFLLDFLRNTRCETLYLVGDIVDLQALRRRHHWPDSHAAVVADLLRIAASSTRVIYIPGNHDAAMRGLVGGCIGGIEVQLWAEHVGADGRRYRVSHGDEYDHERLGKAWLLRAGELAHRGLCWTNRHLNALRRRARLPYLPLSIIAKSRVPQAIEYIQRFERDAARAAAVGGYDGHICGHIHFGGIREIEGVLYMNDGDWFEHCTALVESADGTMELLHWSDSSAELASTGAGGLRPTAWPALPFAALGATKSHGKLSGGLLRGV